MKNTKGMVVFLHQDGVKARLRALRETFASFEFDSSAAMH